MLCFFSYTAKKNVRVAQLIRYIISKWLDLEIATINKKGKKKICEIFVYVLLLSFNEIDFDNKFENISKTINSSNFNSVFHHCQFHCRQLCISLVLIYSTQYCFSLLNYRYIVFPTCYSLTFSWVLE